MFIMIITRVDIELQDMYSQTLLLRVAREAQETVVKQFLEADVNTNSQGRDCGWVPLLLATKNLHEAVVKILLEQLAKFSLKGYSE